MKTKTVAAIVGILIILSVLFYFSINDQFTREGTLKKWNGIEKVCDDSDPKDIKKEFYILGMIKQGLPVKAVIACDGKSISISGSINQTLEILDDVSKQRTELMYRDKEQDLFSSDYNFDGYKDITSLYSEGAGYSAIRSYYIFLYEPKTNTFVFNPQLSDLENIGVDENKKEVYQDYYYFDKAISEGGVQMHNRIVYKWKDGVLAKTSEKTEVVE